MLKSQRQIRFQINNRKALGKQFLAGQLGSGSCYSRCSQEPTRSHRLTLRLCGSMSEIGGCYANRAGRKCMILPNDMEAL
jgi:hypothetical protein